MIEWREKDKETGRKERVKYDERKRLGKRIQWKKKIKRERKNDGKMRKKDDLR